MSDEGRNREQLIAELEDLRQKYNAILEDSRSFDSVQEAEARYRAIVQDQTEFIVRWRPDGIRTFANDSYCRFLGKSFEDLVGKSIFITIKEEDQPAFLQKIKQLTPEQDFITEEHRLILSERGIRIIQWTDRGIFSDSGDLIEIQSVGRDVTEQRMAESSLQESEEKFRTLAEELPNMIFINQRGKVVYANKKCEDMGYTREEFYRDDFDFMSLIAPESLPFIKSSFQKHLEGKDNPPYEYSLIKKNGEKFEAIINTKLIQYKGAFAILGIITDISEQKRIREALIKSEAFYRHIIENAAGVPFRLIFGSHIGEGYYDYMGDGIKTLLGYEPDEFTEKTFQESILASIPRISDMPEDPAMCREMMKNGSLKRFQSDILVKTKSGDNKWLYDSSLPLTDEKTGEVIGSNGVLIEITARKNAEEKLRISEERLNLASEATSDGLWDINYKTENTYFSPRFFTMLGYAPDELPHSFTLIEELMHPEDRVKANMAIQDHIRAQNDGYELEYRLKAKNGEWRWILARGKVVEWDDDGQPVRMLGTHIDISRIKLVERALQFRVDFERLIMTISTRFINLPSDKILSGMDDALSEIGRFTGVDRSYLLLFSKNLEEFSCISEWAVEGLPGFKSRFQHVPTNQLSWWLDKMKQQEVQLISNIDQLPASEERARENMILTGIKSVLEIPMIRSGSLIGVMGLATAREEKLWPDDHVSLLKIVSEIFANSLDRKIMEKAVRESEEKYRKLIELSNDAIYLLYNRRFELINPKFRKMLGYSLEEVNRPEFDFIQLVAQKSRAMIEDRARKLSNGETLSSEYEFMALAKDGSEIDVEASVTYVKYKDGIATQGILRDITERKKLEEQLRQAQKMEAVGRLAGGVAHDFNNLLTAIIGYSQLLLSDLDSKDKIYSDLNEIKKAADRASALTHQLLAFSRKQMLQPRVLDLNLVIKDLDKMLRRLIGEDIELISVLNPDIGNIFADQSQIEQVIMNVVVNSRDAMPSGGKLIMETGLNRFKKTVKKDDFDIKAGNYVTISITDNGTGISQETKAHLFEPFFTTKDVGQGTGLGLSTVYGIVRQSGGFIEVFSELGEGTTFKIYFPQYTKSAREKTPIQLAEQVYRGDETILLVEDEDIVRRLTRKVLTDFGYHILEASYGAEAIRISDTYTEPIHLILTDIIMPKMSGIEMVEKIKIKFPASKILFISGYTETVIREEDDDRGKHWFLQKPFTPIDLVKKVREVLDSK